ncbi:hypothetical protein P8452_68072 [Trifolium repens]|nr:hypothetical protein P8452_68072 [Trifolium repens]
MDPYITPKYFLRPPQHRKKNYYRVQPFCEIVKLVPPGISLVLFFDCCCSGGLFDHSNKQFPINATKLLWSKRTRLPSSVVALPATSSVAYNGDNRYWFEHNSIFTHALLKYQPTISVNLESVIGRWFNMVAFFNAYPWQSLILHEYDEDP